MNSKRSTAGCLLSLMSAWGWAGLHLLAGAPAVAGADITQNPGPADLTGLSLEELATTKVVSVYGASKHEQIETEAPASVTVVTADEIKKAGYRTLSDILNGVRGFYTTYDRGYSYIGVRGFNRPGDYGGRILINIDGHRMNDPLYDSAANGTDFLLDVDLIERVEVIRGPGSSLYGNNAFFAVINVITRRGSDFKGAEISGAYASYDTYSGRLSYGNRFKNGLELVLSGTYYHSEGHDQLFYPEFIHVNNGIAEHSDWSRFGSGFALLSYGDFSLEGGFVQRNKVLPTAAYHAAFNDPREELVDQRAFAELKFQRTFAPDWDLFARLYYDRYAYDGYYPLPEIPYTEPFDPAYPGRITINRDVADSQWVGGEVRLSKTFFEKHRLTAGVEYRYDFILNFLNFDAAPPATYLNTNLTGESVGFYIQDEYAIRRNLILNAGVRYDYFYSFGDTLNPRAALIYTPWTNTTFKAIYGQAFRAPNAFELYYVAPGYLSNTRLRPEKIRSYELVYEQGLNSHLRLTSSLFYDDIMDLISFENAPNGGGQIFGNLAGATAKGGEIEVEGKWADGWRARLSYTYADARDTQHDVRLSNSPEHLAKFNLTAPLWQSKLFANLEVLGMSSRRTVQGNSTPGFAVANFTVFSQQLIKGLELSGSVYNLLDKRYADPVGADFAEDTIRQDGRTFRVKLTYRF